MIKNKYNNKKCKYCNKAFTHKTLQLCDDHYKVYIHLKRHELYKVE